MPSSGFDPQQATPISVRAVYTLIRLVSIKKFPLVPEMEQTYLYPKAGAFPLLARLEWKRECLPMGESSRAGI
jgi:hypothetical protein